MKTQIKYLFIVFISLFLNLPVRCHAQTYNLFSEDEFTLEYVFNGVVKINETFGYSIINMSQMVSEHIFNLGSQEEVTLFKLTYRRSSNLTYDVDVTFIIGNFSFFGGVMFNIDSYMYSNDTNMPGQTIFAPYLIPDIPTIIDSYPLATTMDDTVYFVPDRLTGPFLNNLSQVTDYQRNLQKYPNEPYLWYYSLPYVSQLCRGILEYSAKYNILITSGSLATHKEMFLRMACANLSEGFQAQFDNSLWNTSLNLASDNETFNPSLDPGPSLLGYIFAGMILVGSSSFLLIRMLKKKKRN